LNPQIAQIDADKRDSETYAIIGAAMEVHSTLGNGFLEAVYQEALALELRPAKHSFRARGGDRGVLQEQQIAGWLSGRFCLLRLRDHRIEGYKHAMGNNETAQLLNYLKATGFARGLLLNFGTPTLQYKRIVLTPSENLRPSA
jgi:hypothetical protein